MPQPTELPDFERMLKLEPFECVIVILVVYIRTFGVDLIGKQINEREGSECHLCSNQCTHGGRQENSHFRVFTVAKNLGQATVACPKGDHQ